MEVIALEQEQAGIGCFGAGLGDIGTQVIGKGQAMKPKPAWGRPKGSLKQWAGIDWQLAQSLYLQGCTYAFIKKKTGASVGAVKSRAHRGQWFQKKQEVAAEAKAQLVNTLGQEIKAQRELFTGAIRNQAVKMVNALESRNLPPDLQGLMEHATVVEKVAKIGASPAGFDLDNQSSRPQLINIAVLGSLPGPGQVSQIVDVDTTTGCVQEDKQLSDSPKPL